MKRYVIEKISHDDEHEYRKDYYGKHARRLNTYYDAINHDFTEKNISEYDIRNKAFTKKESAESQAQYMESMENINKDRPNEWLPSFNVKEIVL